jgi:rubrerythrin
MGILLSGADVIDAAVQTEVRGEAFYRQAAAQADKPEAAALFRYLADEEKRHKQLFAGLEGAIVTTDIDPTTWEEAQEYIAATVDGAFFARTDAPIRAVPQAATVAEMLRQAIAFEKETLLFFYSLRDLVTPTNRPLIDEIMAEEKKHIRQLARIKKQRQGLRETRRFSLSPLYLESCRPVIPFTTTAHEP